jgi:hypothetical protein
MSGWIDNFTVTGTSSSVNPYFSDNFNRADGALGSNYTVSDYYNAVEIVGNRVYEATFTCCASGVATLTSNANFANANYKVEADVYASSSYNGTYPQGMGEGIALYARKTAADTYYIVHVHPDDAGGTIMNITLDKVIGGTSTQLGHYAFGNLNGRLDKLGLFVDGSTISVWVAGAQDDGDDNLDVPISYQQVISVTDTGITAIGQAGFNPGMFSTYASGSSWDPSMSGWIDNFTVTGL